MAKKPKYRRRVTYTLTKVTTLEEIHNPDDPVTTERIRKLDKAAEKFLDRNTKPKVLTKIEGYSWELDKGRNVAPPKPRKRRGARALGTSPRQKGTSLRDKGISPRQLRAKGLLK